MTIKKGVKAVRINAFCDDASVLIPSIACGGGLGWGLPFVFPHNKNAPKIHAKTVAVKAARKNTVFAKSGKIRYKYRLLLENKTAAWWRRALLR